MIREGKSQVRLLLTLAFTLVFALFFPGLSRGGTEAYLDALERIDPAPHIEFLSSIQSRYTGYEGCRDAADYIEAQFRSMGLFQVSRDTFQIVVPVDRGAVLEAGEERITIYNMRPNYVRTPSTPETGIGGHIIWGGDGSFSALNGKEVEGNIVLMEFNVGTRWLNAVKLGARAIVFLEPLQAFRTDAEQKYLRVPAPLPRYYLKRRDLPALAAALGAELQDSGSFREALDFFRGLKGAGLERRGTIFSDMAWEEETAYTVSALVPGADPALSEETLVVHAYYDSVSVVPSLNPGADSACGIASLLEIAAFLRRQPPRRTVRLLATPAHFQALGGIRQYAFETIYPHRRRVSGSEAQARGGEPHFFIGLDISSRSNTMAGFYKGHFYDQYGDEGEIRLQRIFSDYGNLLLDWAADISGSGRVAERIVFQSGIVPRYGRGWRTLLPDRVAFDSEVITLSGRPAITLATTGDARNTVGTPADTFESIKPYLDNVRYQAVVSAHLVKQTADIPVIPLNDRIELDRIGSVFGRGIEQALTSYVPTVNVSDAVIGVNLTGHKSLMGVMGRAYCRSDMSGLFEVFGLMQGRSAVFDGFRISPSDGSIHRVAIRGLVGPTDRPRAEGWEERSTDIRLNFIECNSITFFDMVNPLRLRRITNATPLGARSDTELRDDMAVTFVGEPVEGTGYNEPLVVSFIRPDQSAKYMLAGDSGVLLNVSVDLEDKREAMRRPDAGEIFLGHGYSPVDSESFIYRTAFEVARDTHLLNYFRLASLQQAAIRVESLWDLHETAYEHLTAAATHFREQRYDEAYKHSRQAWGVEARVYPEARAISFDVVRGVVFYFALLLPFVIFIERLLFNYVDIRKKLFAIAALFAASYMVLRFVHPAFQLARAPIIILDGFFMLVAGAWTITYLLLKFRYVMEGFRKKISTIHRADVARGSAALAAFILGISNMRKRKVRTALTALTLVLLTFTILSFTSFETMPARMLRHQTGREAPYEGLLLRGVNWGAIPEFEVEDVFNHFRTKDYDVATRTWFVSPDPGYELNLPVRMNESEITLNALLGLDPAEYRVSGADRWLTGGRWFDEDDDDWPFVAILPEPVAYALGVDLEVSSRSYVNVLGRYLRVIGTIDADKMNSYNDLDDEPLTPVDFIAQQYREHTEGIGPALTATGELTADEFITRMGREDDDEDRYVHMDAGNLLLIPSRLCIHLGGTIRAVAASPSHAQQDAYTLGMPFSQVLNEFSNRVNWPIFAGLDGFSSRVMTRGRLSIGGLQGLLIPILIAALIVFNTMLGAVYERTGEITVYAAVGLAPIHIAALFLAESTVFAVVGAMLGYLFGQVISFGLIHVPWLMEGMSLNYSSISAVWSALLVMAIVIASTAWPARMAGKLSVPDETKKFQINKPDSDVWNIVFPFTVSTQEAVGVMSYLHEYFASNDEDSVGAFSAANIDFYEKESKGEHPVIALSADVWIAPLDMGISEKVEIAAVPDEEEPKITLLYFTITRKSGEFATWERMNMGFLKDVRKQMLIWRLVTPEEKKRLLDEGRALLGR